MAVVAIGLRILYFTDEKIKALTAETLSRKLNRQVEIHSLELSIFSRIRITGLEIHDPLPDGGKVFLRLEQLEIRYRLLPLLKRRMEIEKIVIEAPQIYLRQISDSLWNFSDLLGSKPQPPPGAAQRPELRSPLLIVLNSLDLKNGSVHLLGAFDLDLSGADLNLQSFSFRSPHDFSFKALFRISPIDDENLSLALAAKAPQPEVPGKLRVSLTGEISSQVPFRGEAGFVLEDLRVYYGRTLPALSLGGGLEYRYDMEADSLYLDEIYFSLNQESLLKGEAVLSAVRVRPEFRFVSRSNSLELGELSKLLAEFLPGAQIRGETYWENVWAEGNPDKIEAGMSFGIRDFVASDSATGLRVTDLDFHTGLEAALYPSSLSAEVRLAGDFSLGQASYLAGDSVSVTSGGIAGQFEAEVEFPQNRMPKLREVALDAGVNELFGGRASLSLTSPGPQAGLLGSASVEKIFFEKLPRCPISGCGSLRLDFSAVDFDNIFCSYRLFTDSLKYRLQKDSVVLEPLEFSGEAGLSAKKDLSRIELDHLDLATSGLLELSASGEIYNLGRDSLKAGLGAKVKHNRLVTFLPQDLRLSLGELEIVGETEIKARLWGGKPASGTAEYRMSGSVELTDFGMMLPAYETELRGLGGELNLAWDKDRLNGEGLFRLDLLENYRYLPAPLSDCFVSVKASLTNLPTGDKSVSTDMDLFVENFQLDCLSHKFGLTLSGLVSHLNTTPQVRLGGAFDFRSAEAVTLPGDMRAKGGLSLKLSASQRDSLVTLYGSADFQYLNLEMPPLVSIENMNGHIPFYQRIDLGDTSLIRESENLTGTYASSPFNYERLRPYSLSRSDNLSNFRIDRVTFMRFAAQDLEMDIIFGESSLKVPRLVGNLYDGNLYADFEVDLKSLKLGGRKLNLEEVGYRAYLQFSSVNFSEMTGLAEKIITEEKSLTGNVYLRGRGLIPAGELEAEINITQVSAEVLSRIFDFLDPEGTDPGFAMTKTFLDQKYKVIGIIPIRFRPLWFSCPIRHGNIYPSLYADIYTPLPFVKQLIRLPMPIRYDRIPLSVILSQMGAEKEEF